MRIAIDAYWWARGTQSLRNVVHGIVETWAAQHPDDEIIALIPRGDEGLGPSLPTGVAVARTRLWPQALAASVGLPLVARRSGADAVLTHNFAPVFGRRSGVLIHDMIFESSPQWFTRKERVYFAWMKRLAKRADVIFSTSQTEGRRIRRITRAPVVRPIGLGVPVELLASGSRPVDELSSRSFLLVVGRLNARKNLMATLEGARSSGVLGPEMPIVVVGEADGARADMPNWIQKAIDQNEVRFFGFVETCELKWLIENCLLYICLSLDEGFGLPPVEARILGARILVSDIPVFRELLADEALYVDPRDVPAIGLAIQDCVSNPRASEPPAEAWRKRFEWSMVVDRLRTALVEGM